MKPMTEREIIELAKACGLRVCSTEEHHGCPYGDEGVIDCVERLEKDYDAAIQRLLTAAETEERVVRCRECRNHIAVCADEGTTIRICKRTKMAVCFDDFCSRGERRKEEMSNE
mgnify:CR=1 FL=1